MISPPRLLEGLTPLHLLSKVPIMRGRRGDTDGDVWSMVGTGRKVQKATNELQNPTSHLCGPTSRQWKVLESIFPADYIHFARSTPFATYECPQCLKLI